MLKTENNTYNRYFFEFMELISVASELFEYFGYFICIFFSLLYFQEVNVYTQLNDDLCFSVACISRLRSFFYIYRCNDAKR